MGILIVNRNYSPRPSGWTIILLSAAVLALAGCGRKGGLDLPPTASSTAVAAPADPDAEEARRPSVFNPYYGTEALPAATKAARKLSFSIRFSTTKLAMNHFDYRNGVLRAEAVLPNQIRIAGVCCGPTPVTSPLLN
jgi:predicted small lipoprotein YifL